MAKRKKMKIYFTMLLATLSLIAGEIDPKPFKSIKTFAPEHINVVSAYEHELVYELNLEISTPRGSQITNAYVTKDKKLVILGDVVNAKTGESIKRPLEMQALRDNADLIYGTGKEELIVFTDPECPYCIKFEKMWPSIRSKVKMYVYFMPLPGHRNATQMSYYVMKQKDQAAKAKAILDMAHGDKSYERLSMTQQIHELFGKKMKENQALANKFGVRGTPSVFNSKGESVNWPNLGK